MTPCFVVFLFIKTQILGGVMTVYDTEQDCLKDQIRSNRLTIKYLEEKLELVELELLPDFSGTTTKVIEILDSA